MLEHSTAAAFKHLLGHTKKKQLNRLPLVLLQGTKDGSEPLDWIVLKQDKGWGKGGWS